jgi:2-amino-4-hydroxy-6-hydroxymethyldihydropteridine diphosphokinase
MQPKRCACSRILEMILIALGSNISGPWGSPTESVQRALVLLNSDGIKLVNSSRLLLTSAYGRPGQPPFVNAVAQVETHLPPLALLQKLHAVERQAGRRRALRWGPRTLDLDIIDYHGLVLSRRERLKLPHPGIAERIFVLKPIAEIAGSWRHPISRKSAAEMLRKLKGYSQGNEI